MISYFSELRYKEVIDIHTGRRLGYVCDAEFDETEGRLISLITPGKAKFSGFSAGRMITFCRGNA